MKRLIVKQADALPVRLVHDGDGGEVVDAAAVREVDLQKKFYWSPFDLADKLSISRPRATALREHLGIDKHPDCLHVFEFGSQKHPRYSDNVLTRMREAIANQDIDAIWNSHGPGRRSKPGPRAPSLTAPMPEGVPVASVPADLFLFRAALRGEPRTCSGTKVAVYNCSLQRRPGIPVFAITSMDRSPGPPRTKRSWRSSVVARRNWIGGRWRSSPSVPNPATRPARNRR